MEKQKKRKLTPKQEKFVQLETQRILNGGKGTRTQSYREAGYAASGPNVRQEAYKLAHTELVAKELDTFATTLMKEASPAAVAKSIAEDIFQEKNPRVRVTARQQWLKATGNEGPTTLKIKTAWTRLNGFYGDEDDNEKDKPSTGKEDDRFRPVPSTTAGN